MWKILLKLLLIIIIAACVSWLVTLVARKLFNTSIDNPLSTWATIWQAVAAVATILMVLYGDLLKAAVNVPRLKLMVDRKHPLTCQVKKADPRNSDDNASVAEIYLDIVNEAASTAQHCQVVCSCILASTQDTGYTVQHEFCQAPFEYIHGKCVESDLPQSLHRYLKIGAVAKSGSIESSANPPLVTGKKGEKKKAAQQAKTDIATFRVALPDRTSSKDSIVIDSRLKYILIPISVVGVGMEKLSKVIKIHWAGEEVAEISNQGLYQVEMCELNSVIPLLAKSDDAKKIGA